MFVLICAKDSDYCEFVEIEHIGDSTTCVFSKAQGGSNPSLSAIQSRVRIFRLVCTRLTEISRSNAKSGCSVASRQRLEDSYFGLHPQVATDWCGTLTAGSG
jgi:hypothetical protein